jgi:hypothetical protein
VIGFGSFPANPDFAREFHLNRLANAMKLKSDAAAEKTKDQLSRDFFGSFDFQLLQQNRHITDITGHAADVGSSA